MKKYVYGLTDSYEITMVRVMTESEALKASKVAQEESDGTYDWERLSTIPCKNL